MIYCLAFPDTVGCQRPAIYLCATNRHLSNFSINVSVKTLTVSNRNLERPFVSNNHQHLAQTVMEDRAPPAHFQMALDFRPKVGVDIAIYEI
jgi:hypothetical protein